FLAGGRLTDEDAYALSKLARTVFATNDLDHRRHLNGGDLELLSAAGLTGVTYDRAERASTSGLVGLDAEQEPPVVARRVGTAGGSPWARGGRTTTGPFAPACTRACFRGADPSRWRRIAPRSRRSGGRSATASPAETPGGSCRRALAERSTSCSSWVLIRSA